MHACLRKIRIIGYQYGWKQTLLMVLTHGHFRQQPISYAVYDIPPIYIVLRQKLPRLRLSKFKLSSRRVNVSITILRRFSEKKLRIYEGIFVILLMALSFE